MFVVLATVIVRLAVMATGSGQFGDPDNYLPLARSIASGHGLMLNGRLTAYRPPLYPLILAPLVRLAGDHLHLAIAALHLSLGVGTAGLTFVAARRLGLTEGRALAAGLIVAIDPVLAWQSRYVMTETLTAFLIVAAIAELARGSRWSPLLGGGLFGLAALCRPSVLPGAGLVALAAMFARPGSRSERIQRGAEILLAVAVVLSPWAIRNLWIFGEPVWTTTHGGYTLALANNEVYYHDVLDGPPGSVWTGRDQSLWWESVNRRTAGLSEPQADRLLRNTVVELARTEPRRFARACLVRLETFWSVAPSASVYGRVAGALTLLWTAPLWCALVLGLSRRNTWRWPMISALATILGLSGVHAFYWTDLRMRAPVVPAIALIAASAWVPGRIGRRVANSASSRD